MAEGYKLVVVACTWRRPRRSSFPASKYAEVPIVGMEPAVKPAWPPEPGGGGCGPRNWSLDGDLFRRTAAKLGEGIEVLMVPGRGFVEAGEDDREAAPEAEACAGGAVEPMLAQGADLRLSWGARTIPSCCPCWNGSWRARRDDRRSVARRGAAGS